MPHALSRRTLLAALLAVVVLAATFVVFTTLTAHAAATLLSQGKPATASSTENAGTPAVVRRRRQRRHPLVQRVQPIRSGSRSTSAPPPPISQVVLQWEAAYATAFQIQVSADGDDLDDASTRPPPAPAAPRR